MTDAYADPLYAGDVAIGDTGPEVVVEDLEREDFVRYAGASGDFNPIHYDEPYAKEAGNSSVFAQGMLTAGFAAHMISDWFGLEHIDRFTVRFLAQVWPGDTVRAHGVVTDIGDPSEDGAVTVEADLFVTNQDSEDVISGSVAATLPPRPK
jgi:peroxisomal enoyl-CoA hydratase 2